VRVGYAAGQLASIIWLIVLWKVPVEFHQTPIKDQSKWQS
jgi:hypothetical protein